MPRLGEAKKDVLDCEKPRELQGALIRGYPNGATHSIENRDPLLEANSGKRNISRP